jgi:hypothetical protein
LKKLRKRLKSSLLKATIKALETGPEPEIKKAAETGPEPRT